jgi:hypothetical protein
VNYGYCETTPGIYKYQLQGLPGADARFRNDHFYGLRINFSAIDSPQTKKGLLNQTVFLCFFSLVSGKKQ